MNRQEMKMDERLNALADGELNAAESEELLELIEQDPDLRGELCDIHRIKDMLHYAYPEEPKKSAVLKPTARKTLGMVAATVIFSLGTILGITITREVPQISSFALSQVASQQPDKVVLYINKSDPAKFREALTKAEHLLKVKGDQAVEVNIVASAGGIDMLQKRGSPIQDQVKTLASQYASLQFIACNNTISRKKLEGQPVDLIREAQVAPSAVEFIVGRLQEGWSYVAI